MNKEELDAIMKEKHEHDVGLWQQHLDAFIAYKCKQEAIGFAEWTHKERWLEYDGAERWICVHHRSVKETSELYTLYQQSKQAK